MGHRWSFQLVVKLILVLFILFIMESGIILCGGEGRRLRPLTYYFQKTMIPVGRKQKPLLEYIVRLFSYHGIRELFLLVGYKAEQIINYFGDGSRFNVNIIYIRDNPKYRGTAGVLCNAYRVRNDLAEKTLIIYYGDILSSLNLKKVLRFHYNMDADVTLVLSKGYRIRVGVAHLGEENRVVKFEEKPKTDLNVATGILVMNGYILRRIEEIISIQNIVDLMGDLIPYLIKEDYKVYGYISNDFWYDIGSTERYEKLNNDTVDKEFNFIFKDLVGGEIL